MKKAPTKSKPKTKREAAGTDAPAAVAKPVKTRKRQGNVRGLIVELLAGGPMPTAELVAKGKFSAAAAFMHLKALRAEGAISGVRQGREVFYSLADGSSAAATSAPAAAEAAAPARKRGRPAKGKAATKPAAKASRSAVGVPASLQEALEGLNRRLSPIDNLKEKVSVLGQLAGSLPASVARVLTAIRDDLQRLG